MRALPADWPVGGGATVVADGRYAAKDSCVVVHGISELNDIEDRGSRGGETSTLATQATIFQAHAPGFYCICIRDAETLWYRGSSLELGGLNQ